MNSFRTALAIGISVPFISSVPALAEQEMQTKNTQEQLEDALLLIQAQQERLDRQDARLTDLENRLASRDLNAHAQASAALPAPGVVAAQAAAPGPAGDPSGVLQTPLPKLERVGQAPEEDEAQIQLAVLDSQGSVVTRKGQLTSEWQIEYARADRNRAVFRGIELVEAVLVGVFDINESRQDLITGSAALRYGLTDRLELGIRMPYVYRSDTSIIAPVAGSTPNDPAATIDNSVKGNGIGDIELTARYQLNDGGNGSPYVIANLQGVIPTGTDPFSIERDDFGRAQEAATGAGFWGIAPSITAILPTDPVVLFGTLGYTFNLGKSVNTTIPPVIIDYVDPGDAISASAGIGISFNQRTTLNLGYAHSWAFGTRTRTRLIDPSPGNMGSIESTTRDLQIGRLLFGVTYRVTDRASLNWSIEVGATDDATDLRTVLRIPLVLLSGN